MKIKKKFIKILFLILTFTFNLSANEEIKKNNEIILFIHGTVGPLTSIPTSTKELRELFGKTNTNEKTKLTQNFLSRFYQRYLNQSRIDGIHKYQPISDLGLKKFGTSSNKKQLKKFEKLFNQSFKQVNTNKKYSFYTFGWDGRIDSSKRKKWGKILYKELVNLLNPQSKANNPNTNIQIYTHSHGGNVALNLAHVEKKYKKNLKIKCLVLFGTPIQKDTKKLIKSDVFEKIYNIYSENDSIQVLENKLFMTNKTKREFSKKNLPTKVKQIEVGCGNKKPTHWELWFYGKTDSNFFQNFIYHYFFYKKNFPLYPYPISIFTPQVIQNIETNKALSQEQDLYLNINRTSDKNHYSIKISPKENNPIQIEFKSSQR